MKFHKLIFILIFIFTVVGIMNASDKIFPYQYEMKDLPNGLRIVVIPTDYPNIVSLQIPVQVGSRNEVEPGKSGFAHFFEHMMFRGTEKYPNEEYTRILKNTGANQNAYTSDDLTNYYITFAKEDLEKVLELEADRFQNLKYSVEDFKTEARAVLGEYNKNSSNPVSKLFEAQRNTAFKKHTYKHTTMGFIEDIEDMPNQFDYSLQFFNRYYRPERICIIIAGDVDSKNVFKIVEKYWGNWKRGGYQAQIPQEPPPDGPVYEHVQWETETLPWVTVAFHGPAFSETDIDMATMDVISEFAFSSSSDLYQKLVVKEQKVDNLSAYFPDHIDPYLTTVLARLKNIEDIWYVRDEILKTFASLRVENVPDQKVRDIRAHLKYSFANRLNNSSAIASALVGYMARTRDPETINRVYRLYDQVNGSTIKAMANKYFIDKRLVVTTLASGSAPKNEAPAGAIDVLVESGMEKPAEIQSVLLPGSSPIINIRILFNVGPARDPKGKAGLAKLTAQMITEGSSKSISYADIQKALYPMAASFENQVDKEMTVFSGSVHKNKLKAYYSIISDMLMNPAWDENDFKRVKNNLINYIKVNLKRNNDEELAKEVLYEFIYHNHSYGDLNDGHISDLENISLNEVKDFYKENYTRQNLVLGLAGDYGESFLDQVTRDLNELPLWPAAKIKLTQPKDINGYEARIIKKDTRATAISFGFPISVNRAHKDFAALWLVRSYLGEHRSSNSYLYQRIREARGMNYGDYAYIEYFPRGMYQMYPDPNLGRQQQIFQVWIRPVRPEQAHFALRAAVYELNNLVVNGMTQEDFEATRNYLTKFVNLLVNNQDRQLAYALDSRYYGIGDFVTTMRTRLEQLTLRDVNNAIEKYLQTQNIKFVFVTKDAVNLKNSLVTNASSPMSYDAEKSEALLKEDEIIQDYFLKFTGDKVQIVDLEEVFTD